MCRITVTSIVMCLTTFFIVSASTDFAAACGNGELILEDKFATLDSAWEFTSKTKGEPGPNGLTARVPPGKSVSGLNHSGHYKNFELCGVFSVKADPDVSDFVALRFWTPDGDEEYWAVAFVGKGWFVVNHYHDEEVDSITTQLDDPSLLNRDGTNELSVTVDGDKGSFFVNGKKVSDFTGKPPEGGSIFGFVMRADEDNTEPLAFALKSIELHEVGTTGH